MEQNKKLSEYNQKSQNLHLCRFLAAMLVIFSHSFVISLGNSEQEWIAVLTNNQLTGGAIAVSVFFLCGGYLICKSVEKKNTAIAYFSARIIRIVPPLLFVTFLLIIFGGFISDYPMKKYYLNGNTWKYLLNGIMIIIHELPGVFTNNPYNSTVNGSLWTLPVEFICYIICYITFKLRILTPKKYLITFPFFLIGLYIGWIVSRKFSLLYSVLRPCFLFYIGMGFWVYREKIMLKVQFFLFAIIGLIICIVVGFANLGMILFFPYTMFFVWFGLKQCPERLGRLGDYSYAIYLWAFPVQQTIVWLKGSSMNPYMNVIIATPLVFLLGIFTYNIVELPLMKATKKS